jgi:hypothetical protein
MFALFVSFFWLACAITYDILERKACGNSVAILVAVEKENFGLKLILQLNIFSTAIQGICCLSQQLTIFGSFIIHREKMGARRVADLEVFLPFLLLLLIFLLSSAERQSIQKNRILQWNMMNEFRKINPPGCLQTFLCLFMITYTQSRCVAYIFKRAKYGAAHSSVEMCLHFLIINDCIPLSNAFP